MYSLLTSAMLEVSTYAHDLDAPHQFPNGMGYVYVKITVEVTGSDATSTLRGVLMEGGGVYQAWCKSERESLQPRGMHRDHQKGRGVYGAGFSMIHLPRHSEG